MGHRSCDNSDGAAVPGVSGHCKKNENGEKAGNRLFSDLIDCIFEKFEISAHIPITMLMICGYKSIEKSLRGD